MSQSSTLQVRHPTRWQQSWHRSFARLHIFIYQASGGRIGYNLGITKALLLTTTGRKTGKLRVTPIAYFSDGARYILIASNYGSEMDPLWWRNLQVHPEAHVQVRNLKLQVRAYAATGDEKIRLQELASQLIPMYAQYRCKTTREIPIVVLQPIG
jgi:deazaflavin-dependent oxidoreductase (nitroreductase family)